MPHPEPICNIRPAALDTEIVRDFVGDAVNSSLSNSQAAATLLRCLDGTSAMQIIAAAIGLLRRQKTDCDEAIAAAAADLEIEIARGRN
jgi:hypothetical protein